MIGNSYRSPNHGVESVDLQNSRESWCPTDVNKLRLPFRYILEICNAKGVVILGKMFNLVTAKSNLGFTHLEGHGSVIPC
jgi:hypothetical protein